MKSINLKRTFALLAVIFLTTAFLITGCSKQEIKTITADTTKKNVTQEQGNQQTPSADNQTAKPLTSAVPKEDKTETTKDTKSEKPVIQHTTISIPTAQCDQCKSNIEKALDKLSGIQSKDVDVDNKVVTLDFDKTKLTLAKIELAITSAGYEANDKLADPNAYSKLDDCCKLPQDRKKNKSN